MDGRVKPGHDGWGTLVRSRFCEAALREELRAASRPGNGPARL